MINGNFQSTLYSKPSKDTSDLQKKLNTQHVLNKLTNNTKNNISLDLVFALLRLNKAAQVIFVELINNSNNLHNISFLTKIDSKSNKYKVFARHINVLKKEGLIKKLPAKYINMYGLSKDKAYFIINPHWVEPEEYKISVLMWNKSK